MISVKTFHTLGEAAGAIGGSAIYFGGGTLVMRALNYGEQKFDTIICSQDPVLKHIARIGDRIEIGAGVTMANVIASSELGFLAPVARSIGGPAVRNMGTVGGNLFAAHPYGDFTVALLALDGRVKMADGNEQDMETFLSSRETNRNLVASVSIAVPSGSDFRYRKVSRVKPKGISVMSIAVWIRGSGNNPRIAFGAMGNTPMRAKCAEQALSGGGLDAARIGAACAALNQDFQPHDDAIASGWYRTQVAPVHLRRLLEGQV